MSTETNTVTVTYDEVEHIAWRVTAKALQDRVPKVAASIASQVVDFKDKERQEREDLRANRRNRNRSLTLVVALLFTFAVPYIVANVIHDAPLLKYATGIAIIPDALITLYAYWRKY